MQFAPFLLPASLLALMSVISGAIIPRATGTVPATFYSPNGAVGACGVAIQNSNFSVALNTADFKNGASCGEDIVVSVEGVSAHFTAEDLCSDCAPGGIKLTSGVQALLGIGTPESIQVTWNVFVAPPPTKHNGSATIFTPSEGQSGACGNAITGTDLAIAMSDADLEGGVECNKNMNVTLANGKSITASVQDVCADCASGSIGLTSSAFEALTGSNSAKPVEIVWFFVPEF